DLSGCMAHGETEAEALEQAREAIRLYLDVLTQSGGAIPQPREYHLLPA
ncbi:MAG: type II toxin-antitoxin system HicB family antitoxin, partial [Thermoanaerobaculia bacterium]